MGSEAGEREKHDGGRMRHEIGRELVVKEGRGNKREARGGACC